MRKQALYDHVLGYLGSIMDATETELNYTTPFELLVAVVLSAQCTDKRINQVTPRLFADFPTPEAMAVTTPEVIFEYIKSVSYPNNKAKHLVGLAKMLVEKFQGEVPSTLEELSPTSWRGTQNSQRDSSCGFWQSGTGGRYTRVSGQSPPRIGSETMYYALQCRNGTEKVYSRALGCRFSLLALTPWTLYLYSPQS